MSRRVRTCRGIRASRWAVTALVAVAVGAVSVAGAAALVPSITKDDYIEQVDAICEAGNAKIDAAAEKLGDSPTDKQVKAFAVKVFVPNVSSQIAQIRKLGYPKGDKAQLSALYNAAERILVRIENSPGLLLTADENPFSAVMEEQRAYGFTVCGADDSDPVSVAQQYAGTYQGTWTNTTFGSTGTVKIEVVVDASAKTVKVTTTLTGNVFGAPAPAPETVTVPLGTAQPGQPVTVTSPLFGPLTLSVKGDGTVVGDAPDVPSAAIKTFHVELEPSATGLDGSYTVALASGTNANGTLTLTHS